MATFRDIMAPADAILMADLGEAVSISTDDGIPLGSVTGIFDIEYVEIQGVESLRPVFTCRAQSIPEGCHDYRLTYDGKTYAVDVPRPDGTGLISLVLREL